MANKPKCSRCNDSGYIAGQPCPSCQKIFGPAGILILLIFMLFSACKSSPEHTKHDLPRNVWVATTFKTTNTIHAGGAPEVFNYDETRVFSVWKYADHYELRIAAQHKDTTEVVKGKWENYHNFKQFVSEDKKFIFEKDTITEIFTSFNDIIKKAEYYK